MRRPNVHAMWCCKMNIGFSDPLYRPPALMRYRWPSCCGASRQLLCCVPAPLLRLPRPVLRALPSLLSRRRSDHDLPAGANHSRSLSSSFRGIRRPRYDTDMSALLQLLRPLRHLRPFPSLLSAGRTSGRTDSFNALSPLSRPAATAPATGAAPGGGLRRYN
jgi:hypothetical protein